MQELVTCEARGGDSRPLLLALAWTVRPQIKSSQIHNPVSPSQPDPIPSQPG